MSEPHDQKEETSRQVDPSGLCAHLRVDYDPIEHAGKAKTTYTSRWRCHDCNLEFIPGRLAEYIARAAFPEQETMRDRFAMAALISCASGCINDLIMNRKEWQAGEVARLAYQLADDMMKARK